MGTMLKSKLPKAKTLTRKNNPGGVKVFKNGGKATK